MTDETSSDRDRFRELKKAWKLPKGVRQPILWASFFVGLGLVGWELVCALQLWLGGSA